MGNFRLPNVGGEMVDGGWFMVDGWEQTMEDRLPLRGTIHNWKLKMGAVPELLLHQKQKGGPGPPKWKPLQ